MTSTTAPTSNLAPFAPQITRYQQWLADTRGLHFDNYDALWRWSTTDLDAYWQSIWDYFDIQSETPHTAVLAHNVMPGAKWFPGATINYAQQALRHQAAADAAGCAALVCDDERGHRRVLTWSDLQLQVAALATHLKAQGVQPGDRVAATDAEVREAARLAGALEFIEAQPEGFQTKVGERGGRLSGGQRQRVSIARAFLKDAPILILDEATSALDTDTERSIQQSLALLMKGRTTLIVAHRFSTIRDVNRVLVFDGGRIVADGTRESVYATSDLFRRLWDNQAKNLA